MTNPKEIWIFHHDSTKMETATVVGRSSCGCYLYYEFANDSFIYLIPKSEAIFTRKQAAEACLAYHNKRIKQLQKELDEQKRLLGKFYLEELYE